MSSILSYSQTIDTRRKVNVTITVESLPVYGYGYGYNRIDGTVDFFDIFGMDGDKEGYFVNHGDLSLGYQYGFGYEYTQNFCSLTRTRKVTVQVTPDESESISAAYGYGYGYSQYVDSVDYFDLFGADGSSYGYSSYGPDAHYSYGYGYGFEYAQRYSLKIWIAGQGVAVDSDDPLTANAINEGVTDYTGMFEFYITDDSNYLEHVNQLDIQTHKDFSEGGSYVEGSSLGEIDLENKNSYFDMSVEVIGTYQDNEKIKVISSTPAVSLTPQRIKLISTTTE